VCVSSASIYGEARPEIVRESAHTATRRRATRQPAVGAGQRVVLLEWVSAVGAELESTIKSTIVIELLISCNANRNAFYFVFIISI